MPGDRVRVVHYLNRFFAGLGGEEASSGGVALGDGPVGAGRGLQQELGADAEVVATIYCGDTYFAEHPDDARHEVLEAVRRLRPDVLVAGPAFNAGRYGFACAEVCETVAKELGIPCVTGYYPQAPGVEVYRQYRNHRVYAVPTRDVAAGMKDALHNMARLAVRVGRGEAVGPAAAEGYIPRGLRREVTIERPGTERAIEMVLSKIAGARFTTEIPLVKFDDVPPAPALPDMRRATIAVISTSGVVPAGNPDRFKSAANTFWRKYDIGGLTRLDPKHWQTVHGGYHTEFVNRDPHYGVPLDVMRELEDTGAIGKLHESAYLFPGGSMDYSVAKRLGREIADDLSASDVDGVLLVST